MPQLVKKRRSGWAVLAAGALVASLLAVGASPAAAIDEDSEQDHTTTSSACVGAAAAHDAGFTDLGSLEAAVDDINCLKYYGITTGRTDDTFDPNSNVTRSQMALFLYRSAGVMGIDLMGGDMDADFGDIAELGEDRQNAINALARNGILAGRGDMAFDPGSDITRAEMAVALVNLVDHVSSNLGRNDAGLFVFGDDEDPPNDSFGDAYRTLSEPVNNAISAAYELGITTGRPAGSDTFAPNDGVPRRNMATFIMRALRHSNVRPEGLSAQLQTRAQGSAAIVVSVRDAAFAPVVNVAIDAFRTAADQEDRAFKTDGSCSSRAVLVDGASKCEIDGADPVTTSLGNIGLAQLSAEEIDKGLTMWIWQGDVGDEFGNDTDVLELSVDPQPEVAATASQAAISSDLGLKGNGKARYGQTVTFTIQLQDEEESAAVPPEDGVEYKLSLDMFNEGLTLTTAAAETAISRTPGKVTIGSDGSGTFIVTARDLDTANDSEVTVRYTVSREVTYNGTLMGDDEVTDEDLLELLLVPELAAIGADDKVRENTVDAEVSGSHSGVVVFSDEAAEVGAVAVSVTSRQSAPRNGKVGTAATVTVLDQYGRPFADRAMVLVSNQTDADTSSAPRYTGPSGQVRIGYSYGGSAAVETLTALYSTDVGALRAADGTTADAVTCNPETGAATITYDDDDGEEVEAPARCGTEKVFWVSEVVDDATVDFDADIAAASRVDIKNDGDGEVTDTDGTVDVLSLDAEDQQIVINDAARNADEDDDAPSSVSYDSNDFFTVGGTPTTMAAFADALAKAVKAFDDSEENDKAEPTLAWTGYVFDDTSSSTWFQLVTNLAVNDP